MFNRHIPVYRTVTLMLSLEPAPLRWRDDCVCEFSPVTPVAIRDPRFRRRRRTNNRVKNCCDGRGLRLIGSRRLFLGRVAQGGR